MNTSNRKTISFHLFFFFSLFSFFGFLIFYIRLCLKTNHQLLIYTGILSYLFCSFLFSNIFVPNAWKKKCSQFVQKSEKLKIGKSKNKIWPIKTNNRKNTVISITFSIDLEAAGVVPFQSSFTISFSHSITCIACYWDHIGTVLEFHLKFHLIQSITYTHGVP